MNKDTEKIAHLREQIAGLQARLADLHARLPAHSIHPAMIAELDELDELQAQAQEQLAAALKNESDQRMAKTS
jgi:uncharacterized protein involved in exopolysaccharide biosynthesis